MTYKQSEMSCPIIGCKNKVGSDNRVLCEEDTQKVFNAAFPPGSIHLADATSPFSDRLPRNPEFVFMLNKMRETHDIKSHDYAQDSNVFSNFEVAAYLASLFDGPVHKAFATLIGVKIARLSELLNGKSPKNEGIFDTFLDLGNYCVIWASYWMKRNSYKIAA